jgi:hypothetical protein
MIIPICGNQAGGVFTAFIGMMRISPRLSLVILMKGHEYVLCAVPIDNTK